MPELMSCPHGHRWEPAACPPQTAADSLCPVCGAPGQATPPGASADITLSTPSACAALTNEEIQTTPPLPRAALAGPPVIPGYEILGELGRGGMGIVYKARQLSLNRLVALKVIAGERLANPNLLARFHTEAEALARLQHPNIVQIYEVNQAQSRPYVALEYVEGGALTRRLGGVPQPADEAARLLLALARAMHFAHQRHVLHRDLKPANVLLTPDGTPKVTDFGLAKLLEGETGPTRSGEILGTPSYMAPEQAGGVTRQLGPAVDVYALGAILYEMLTGRPPFLAVNPVDTLLQVLTEDPVPPRRLQPKVPRDLETICLKCLRKHPGSRYADAGALAADLERFLAGKPILARPVPIWERLLKWVRRRPAAAALFGMTVAAAVVFMVGVWVHNAQLQVQKDVAQRRSALALAAVDRMLTRVSEDEELLVHEPRMELVRRKILDDAVALYQDLLKEDSSDAKVRFETGRAFVRVGDIRGLVGEYAAAEGAYDRALALLRPLAAEYAAIAAYRKEQAVALYKLGDALRNQARLEEAEHSYREALRMQQQLVARFPDAPGYRQDLAQTYNNLGNLMKDIVNSFKRPQEAKEAHHKALALREALAAAYPRVPEYQRDLSQSYHNVAVHLGDAHRDAEAEAMYRKAIAIRTRLMKDFPRVPLYQQYLTRTLINLSLILRRVGRTKEAAEVCDRVVALREKLVEEFPRAAKYRDELALSLLERARLHYQAREASKAAADVDRGLALRKKLAEEHPDLPSARRALAECYNLRGWLSEQAGAAEKATAEYKEAIRVSPDYTFPHYNLGRLALQRREYDRAIADFTQSIQADADYAWAYYYRGKTYQAKQVYDKAIADYNRACILDPTQSSWFFARATAYTSLGQPDRAIEDYTTAIRLKPNFPVAYNNRGHAWQTRLDFAKALADYDKALALDPHYTLAYRNRGYVWGLRKDFDRAIANYAKAHELDPNDAWTRGNLIWAYFSRGNVRTAKGDYGKALADLNKALELDSRCAAAHNNLAWLYATCPDDPVRDGKSALGHGFLAVWLTSGKQPLYLDTLAAALAESGQFERAAKMQKAALDAADYPAREREPGRLRLALYEKGKAYRQERITPKATP